MKGTRIVKTKVTRLPIQHKAEQAPRDYLEYRLIAAAETFTEKPVDGAGEALAAVTEHLRVLGIAHPAMAPLEALLSAMNDLHQGRQPVLLRLDGKQGRPGLTTGVRSFRAAVVALAEYKRKGRRIEEACRWAALQATKAGKPTTTVEVQGWRKDILSHRAAIYDAPGEPDLRDQTRRWAVMLERDGIADPVAWLKMRLQVK